MAKLTVSFKGKKLKVYPLLGEETLIGRDPACTIHIDSLAIEPRHAMVRQDGAAYHINAEAGAADLVINGQPTREHELADGDHVQVGKHTLDFATEAAHAPTMPGRRVVLTGWMQIMNGSHLGRTIRLDRSMTRLGKAGLNTAIVARRSDGYYISQLEGDTPPLVNGDGIGERTQRLDTGDVVRIGQLEMQFFLDAASPADLAPVPPEDFPQRRFSRIPFDAAGTLTCGDTEWPCHLLDVSLKGALVERPADWVGDRGNRCRLDLRLDDGTIITMSVDVAHVEDQQLGLHCHDIDLDSITHLRRLVELNLGDPDLLERELSALG